MDFVKKASREQIKMVSLSDFVLADSAALQIDKLIDEMDTSYFSNSELNEQGRPPYNPKDLLKLLIYGMENGIVSSRKLKRECVRNMELRWLVGEIIPDAKTISSFRTANAENMKQFFNEYAQMLCEQGYIDGKIISIDGTKIRANNSKRSNFSVKKLDRHIEYIKEKLAQYQNDLDKNDKIEELEERKAKYESYKEKIEKGEVSEVSTTDPDSRLMKQGNNGVDVSYNVQAAVDAKNKLIAGFLVVNEPNDQGQLHKVAKSVKDNLKLKEMTVLGDKGYYDTENFKACHDENITTIVAIPEERNPEKGMFRKKDFSYDSENDCYQCPACQILKYSYEDKNGFKRYQNLKACKSCPMKSRCTKSNRREICRHKYAEHAQQNDLAFKENYELYKQRQCLSEHPFGTVKRTMGIRQFQTCGTINVSAEAALIFLCYNLKRLRTIAANNSENTTQTSLFSKLLTQFSYFYIQFIKMQNLYKIFL